MRIAGVTEREFDVARAADPEKILVYAKELPPGVREPKAERLLEKASSFSKGYFRSTFASPAEFEKRLSTDMAIWITDRIHERRVSVSHVLNLPEPGDLRRQAQYLGLIVALCFLSLEIFTRMGNVSDYILPSGGQILSAYYRHADTLASSALSSFALSGVSYCLALCGACVVTIFALYVLPHRHRLFLGVCATLGLVLSVFLFLMGPFLLGVGSTLSRILSSTLAPATVLLMIALSEIRRGPKEQCDMSTSERRALLDNMLLAPGVSYAYMLTFALAVLQEMLFSGSRGLGTLFQRSILMFETDLAYATFFGIVVFASSIYFGIRLLQCQIGWVRVVAPILSHLMGDN